MAFVKDLLGHDAAKVDALRVAALEEIGSPDHERVELALLCLMLVGVKRDVRRLTPLQDHESEYIRNAAKACEFAVNRNEPEGQPTHGGDRLNAQ